MVAMNEDFRDAAADDDSLARNGERRSLEHDLDILKGYTLEMKMVNKITPLVCAKLELRAGFIVRGGHASEASTEFDDLLYDAYKRGAIGERERDRINWTDMIISAFSRISGARAYVAVEASNSVDARQATLARHDADILARAFPDAETHAAVYCRAVNPDGRKEADRLGVSVFIASSEIPR